MTALLALWPIAKRFLPWIALIAGLISVYLYLDHRSFQRGAESRNPEILTITKDRDTYKSNADVMSAARDTQNAAVLKLKTESDARVKAGQEALAAVEKQNASLLTVSASLKKSAGLTRANDGKCAVSAALAMAKDL